MVDKEMLTAIAELLDEKLEEKLEQKLEEKLEEKLDQKLDQKLDEKLDQKLQPVYDRLDRLESDMKYVRVVQLENHIIPRLNTIEACYVDTAKRYVERTEQIDAMCAHKGSAKRCFRPQPEIEQDIRIAMKKRCKKDSNPIDISNFLC